MTSQPPLIDWIGHGGSQRNAHARSSAAADLAADAKSSSIVVITVRPSRPSPSPGSPSHNCQTHGASGAGSFGDLDDGATWSASSGLISAIAARDAVDPGLYPRQLLGGKRSSVPQCQPHGRCASSSTSGLRPTLWPAAPVLFQAQRNRLIVTSQRPAMSQEKARTLAGVWLAFLHQPASS